MILNICNSFFTYLNTHNIRYCHWKSNSRLDKALEGKTDLDILIHKDDKKEFELALKKFALKRILSPPEKQFPDMEDYLGFDYATGKLIHLHVHYSLILGQKYIKNHLLPIEAIIFQNLITKDNIHIPCPEIELILLIIRAHMKTDIISLIKHGIKDLSGAAYSPFPADIEEEFLVLINNSDIEKLSDLVQMSKLPLSEEIFIRFVASFTEKRLRSYEVLRTIWQIFKALKGYRRDNGILVYLKYLRFVISYLPGINRIRKPKKKTLPGRGKIISLVGADGSGKSTLIKDLEKWLSWKLTVNSYYYGIPKTRFIKIFSYAIYGLKKLRLHAMTMLLEYLLWTYIAKKRYKISILSQEDASNGVVVITDRFPLKDFQDMPEPMDGPRLRQSSSIVGSIFSRIEERYYNDLQFPDRIFVLQADLNELRRRKNDLDLITHKAKADAVNAIQENAQIILIDANKPYSDVVLTIKRKVWESL